MNKKWNVVAIMATLLSLSYVGVAAGALFVGKLSFSEFSAAVLPIVTAWSGYLAAMLKDTSSQ